MRLSRYDDGPIRRLHAHVRAELERNPYAEGAQARYPERRRATNLWEIVEFRERERGPSEEALLARSERWLAGWPKAESQGAW